MKCLLLIALFVTLAAQYYTNCKSQQSFNRDRGADFLQFMENYNKLLQMGRNGLQQYGHGMSCLNGGVYNEAKRKCTCQFGYYGEACHLPICRDGCVHGYCHKPEHCRCAHGWLGKRCDQGWHPASSPATTITTTTSTTSSTTTHIPVPGYYCNSYQGNYCVDTADGCPSVGYNDEPVNAVADYETCCHDNDLDVDDTKDDYRVCSSQALAPVRHGSSCRTVDGLTYYTDMEEENCPYPEDTRTNWVRFWIGHCQDEAWTIAPRTLNGYFFCASAADVDNIHPV